MNQLQKIGPTAKSLGVSTGFLKRLKNLGVLLEGVHCHKLGYNLVLYCPELIGHYLQTRSQPELHEAKIREYLASLEAETSASKKRSTSGKGR